MGVEAVEGRSKQLKWAFCKKSDFIRKGTELTTNPAGLRQSSSLRG
jgi:hypothetical protein